MAYASVVKGDLAGAIDAVQGERWPEALHTTLAVWRDVRAPELGDAYDAIAARALDVITPPFATDPAERNSRWLELRKQLGDPMVRIGLLQVAAPSHADQGSDRAPRSPAARRARSVRRDDDLRSARGAVGPRGSCRYDPFFKYAWALLPRLGDPRVLARAHRFPEAWARLPSDARDPLQAALVARDAGARSRIRGPSVAASRHHRIARGGARSFASHRRTRGGKPSCSPRSTPTPPPTSRASSTPTGYRSAAIRAVNSSRSSFGHRAASSSTAAKPSSSKPTGSAGSGRWPITRPHGTFERGFLARVDAGPAHRTTRRGPTVDRGAHTEPSRRPRCAISNVRSR